MSVFEKCYNRRRGDFMTKTVSISEAQSQLQGLLALTRTVSGRMHTEDKRTKMTRTEAKARWKYGIK